MMLGGLLSHLIQQSQGLGGGQLPQVAPSRFNGPDAAGDPGVQAMLAAQRGGLAPVAPQGLLAAQAAPAPSAGPAMQAQGQGIGGFIENLINPGASVERKAVQWLTGRGMDPGMATFLAKDKTAMRSYIMKMNEGKQPIEVGGRLVDPVTYEVIADFSDRDLKEADYNLNRNRFLEERHQFDQTQGLEREKFGHTRETDDRRLDLDESRFDLDREKAFLTPDILNYRDYANQEIKAGRKPLPRLEWEKELKRAGATNIDNRQMGTIPPGYEAQYDESGRPVRMIPIPGGPADAERQAAASQQDAQLSAAMNASDVVTTAATRAREAAANRNAGSTGTSLVGKMPWTDSAEVLRQVEVLKAQAAASNLQAMRDASPTGGALGNVTERELDLLANKSGALNPDSPNFLRDLEDYERTLLRTVHGREAGDKIFEATRQKKQQAPSGYRIIGVE